MPKTYVENAERMYQKFNDFVRGELKRRSIKQEELAMYLNVSRSTLSYRLSGRIEWNLKDAFRTMDYLQSDFNDI